jgi:cyclic beta-1,2-glucan glucanotransferase
MAQSTQSSLLDQPTFDADGSIPVLLTQEQLEAHAIVLATMHTISPAGGRVRQLLPRLQDSAERLEKAYQFLTVSRNDPVASEDWLRDNYHVVQDQVREVRQDLPKKFYLELPKLADGPYQGYPRVYLLARELIAHTAGRLDLDTLVDFTAAYQRVAPLSIGETWAVPIMLRLSLVEELQRLVDDIVDARRSREQARKLVSSLTSGSVRSDTEVEALLRAETRVHRRLSAPFVVEVLQWLRDQPSSAAPAWTALQRALEGQGDTPEELLRAEHQREATGQLGMGNLITSMRLLSTIDWPLFFDRVSVVERALCEDPARAYGEMDFATRDRYRHSVEQLAKRSKQPELTVARRAVELAGEARASDPLNDRRHHVGYYLISRGRFRLEGDLGYPPSAGERLARFFFKHPAIGYLGTIAVTVALGVSSLVAYAGRRGAAPVELWLVAMLTLIPVSELVISLINAILTSRIPPRPLPKLALRKGIPAESRTLVVVPAIIESGARAEGLLHDLEVRFLANRDPHLHFALLSDFPDADVATEPGDEALMRAVRQKIEELQERHGDDRFFLLHRERRWNGSERRWMGWERKRGKLAELNRLLRGATDTSFTIQVGRLPILHSVKYVITLDSDTRLPMEAARRLVGTLSHPLNRPRLDSAAGRVTEGYGVLQPRVQVSVESASRTTFGRVYSGHVGMDPYTTAVSDVYQDLFHEGSYVGKGIYDVDAFDAALSSRVPENTLLSHDLFEGFYARAGLCTDIELVDDYPVNYLVFAARLHRWVRGDWQIVRWLLMRVPDASGRLVPNTLPAIARWKILDNLRRSLLAPALVGLFVAGWTILPGGALPWSTLAVLVLAFPAYMQVGRSLSSRYAGVPLRQHILAERDSLATSARQAFLSAVFLLHQSGTMIDAIARTFVRMSITRKRLLEWVTADRAWDRPLSLAGTWLAMRGTPIAAALMGILVAAVAPGRLPLAVPMLVLWGISPLLAYVTGQELRHDRGPLHRADRDAYRRIARRTWRFFDDFMGPPDNWLMPDNLQENRRELIAHRTSPTNIGLQLLSTLAAHDFGYVNVAGLLNRLEPAFDTLLRLPRYRGHFYNWYDTRTLALLPPAYISTVDSGNLAGYFLTLRAGLIEIAERSPAINPAFLGGLRDLADLVQEEATRAVEAVGGGSPQSRRLRRDLTQLRDTLDEHPENIAAWHGLLRRLKDQISGVAVLAHELEEWILTRRSSQESAAVAMVEASYWLDRAAATVVERQADLQRLGPLLEAIEVHDGPDPPAASLSLGAIVRGRRVLDAIADVRMRAAALRGVECAEEWIERMERLGALADDFVEETEFGFLFAPERQLFSIGFNVAEGRLDASYYDTLASEARLASFMAIATGKIAPEHWFKLGRALTPAGRSRALLSWSASMFEYLMPLLVMRSYPGTLLDETYGAIIERQVRYGERRGVPWGVSESVYYAQDLEGNYQYRAFGVPGLGLKRGLGDEMVVAPYASLLAAPLAPREVLANLERLRAQGMTGRYGYYDAIDYTVDRLPKDHVGGVPLVTYMAHHQGMTLLALDNALHDSPMQARFHSDPRVRAAELVLQERLPHLVPLKNPPIEKAEHVPWTRQPVVPQVRRYITPHTLSPRTHLLSNGSYAVMLTNAGGGYSRRQSLAMTRWREDATTDAWGTFIYVRDLENGDVWSTAYHPTRREPDEYEASFAADRATFRRVDGQIELRTEIVVSPEDDVELRRVSVTNHGNAPRSLELTSYAEVVLGSADADLAHPAFSNLFIETAAIPERDALLCTRRPRTGTTRLHLFHVVSGRGSVGGASEYETDRARFTGRGHTLEFPAALASQSPLSNTTGAVLDPIVSLRQTVRVPPGGTARLAFATGFAEDELTARRLIDKYHDRRAVARSLALASTHTQIELRHLGLTVDETMRFQRLGGRLLYADARLRDADAVRRNTRPQSELWKYGVSGDMPILLVSLRDHGDVTLFRELVKAHEYLRRCGFAFDLVALNEHSSSYLQDLHHALMQIVESGPEQGWIDKPGGIFIRRFDLMPPEDRTLLRAAARVVMDAANGTLHEQLKRMPIPYGPDAGRVADLAPRGGRLIAPARPVPAAADLELFNGVGGFAAGGREYVVALDPAADRRTPNPWSNVVAHPTFGFVTTESGGGCTWSENSHDNRLTPWRNDPVSDPPGEVVFVRDEDSGAYWSATPLPAGGGGRFVVRHGQGSTTFERSRDGVSSTLVLSIPTSEPVKLFHLTLQNDTPARRRLSVTLYVDWVLGESRERSRLHVVTSRDPVTGAILARNAFRQEFSTRVAFLDLHPGDRRSVTADRAEFIGRNGTLRAPAALAREGLSGRTGAGFDPCGAIRLAIDLEPRGSRTVVGLLGDAPDAGAARALVQRFRQPTAADDAIRDTRAFWDGVLDTLVVRTPDRSFDLMMNRWALYQCLACRIWGRSAFYQSSGAFGFRDQLQDVLSLLVAAPQLARAQLVRAASRQFVEGDVLHWWHEPGGQGVRTRFADDRLWLPYAAMRYIDATGDSSILDEPVSFLEGRPLRPDEHEAYEHPTVSQQRTPIYEHCVRAIEVSLGLGPHGLPLIGTGDWNDGMNMIGPEGRGESVWLGWFLSSILREFASLAEARGESDRANRYRGHAELVLRGVEAAWDGEWYRRAYFDDGTPLGSRENTECRIDAIAQSWAVIAGGGAPERAVKAMESCDQHLVRRSEGIVLLLTPPFDRMQPSPGYIQGYVPGVRENGGQYTHAALWTVLAFAGLGDGDRAAELFALLNPINHGRTREEVDRYRAEPYVIAADVYSRAPHSGRGGWTWYTGSAGWMYRVGIEAILGIRLERAALRIDPCIPRSWPRFEARLRRPNAELQIVVENPRGVCRGVVLVEVDGTAQDGSTIDLDHLTGRHTVRVVLGDRPTGAPT